MYTLHILLTSSPVSRNTVALKPLRTLYILASVAISLLTSSNTFLLPRCMNIHIMDPNFVARSGRTALQAGYCVNIRCAFDIRNCKVSYAELRCIAVTLLPRK
jgi:hypothetical protein